MKNTLILVLVFSIILSGILPLRAYGETVDEKLLEEVVLKVKGLFNISDDYDNFTSRISSYEDQVSFYLSWSDSNEELPNISINADSKGNVISFNKYYSQEVKPDSKLPKLSNDQALKIAMDFIKKVDSAVYNELELKETGQVRSTWDRHYNFNFIRNINDIPYTFNTVNISINIETGEVTSLYINWERNLEFPDAKNIISLDKAKDAYENEIGLKLVYKRSGRNIYREDSVDSLEYFLAYSNLGNLKGIDSKTGKSIDISYFSTYYGLDSVAEENMAGGGEVPIITPEEREEIGKLKGLKSIEEVEKKARDILKLDNSYEIRRKNLYSSWENPDEFYYSLSFVKIIEEREYNTEVSINAKSLELMSFYKYRDIAYNAKAVINKSQALQLAKDFINEINPDKAGQVELIETNASSDQEQYYGFNFIRKVDDIYVESDSISIGVDAVNKDINSYYINWYKGEFPSRENTISLEKAYEVLFDKLGLNLNYTNIYNYDNINQNQEREVKLVYSISQDKPTIIDAFTGDILDYSGNVYKDNIILSYSDIDNSYAKDKIMTLAQYGVGFSGDKFNPKNIIRQDDFLYLLWKSMDQYSGYLEENMDDIYKDLIRRNIINPGEEAGDSAVTKEEAVKFVIRAMGYDKLAELPNIYSDIFPDGEDIDADLKGHMNLAYGLKIINGDGTENIRPKYELKRQDAASIIYNYMFN